MNKHILLGCASVAAAALWGGTASATCTIPSTYKLADGSTTNNAAALDDGSGNCIFKSLSTNSTGSSIYGTAGTANASVATVQGIASMTPLLATVSQGTAASLNATVVGTGTFVVQAAQSGNWTARLVGNAGATVDATIGGGTAPTNMLAVGGQYRSAAQTLTNLQSSALQLDVNGGLIISPTGISLAQASTTSGQNGSLVMGAVTTAAPTYTTAQSNPLSLDTSGNVRVNCTTGCSSSSSSGATGSAPPSSANYLGANGSGATGGLMRGLITCDLHAVYDASDNGLITVVTGVSGRKTYVCGFTLATGGTATNMAWKGGTGTNCATTSYALTPVYQLIANDRIGANSAFWNGMITTTAADNICISASAGNAHQGEIWYTIL